MKLLLLLTLLVSIVAALELAGGGGGSELEERQSRGRQHKKTRRPRKTTSVQAEMKAARRPSGAPDKYKTYTDKPSRKRSKSGLKRLPADLVDADAEMRRARDEHVERMRVAAALKRQSTANDFYECQNAKPAPSDADCQVIIDQVFATGQTLIISANACTVFSYQTCTGFFCALCTTLETTTDFIGNQLSSAEALCVAGGQEGTVVGQDPPQWDAGFVYETNTLPTYDVC